MGKQDKGFWDKVKEGFQPASARADQMVQENRQKYGNKLESDLAESQEERARKLREGFIKRVKP